MRMGHRGAGYLISGPAIEQPLLTTIAIYPLMTSALHGFNWRNHLGNPNEDEDLSSVIWPVKVSGS